MQRNFGTFDGSQPTTISVPVPPSSLVRQQEESKSATSSKAIDHVNTPHPNDPSIAGSGGANVSGTSLKKLNRTRALCGLHPTAPTPTPTTATANSNSSANNSNGGGDEHSSASVGGGANAHTGVSADASAGGGDVNSNILSEEQRSLVCFLYIMNNNNKNLMQ